MADISQIKLPNGDTFDIVDNKSGFLEKNHSINIHSGSIDWETNSFQTQHGLTINSTSMWNEDEIGGQAILTVASMADSATITLDTQNYMLTLSSSSFSLYGRNSTNYITVSNHSGGLELHSLVSPTNDSDAATKKYVDDAVGGISAGVTKISTTAGAHTAVTNATGAVSFNVPTTAAHVGIKFGYTTSGNNRAVLQDSSGNLYVTQKDDNSNTTYTLSGALSSHKFTSTLTAGGSGSGTSTSEITFAAGSNVTLTDDTTNKKITIAATDTTYSSKAAASGGTDVSLVTTGEKYTWNSKTSNTGTVTSVAATGSGGITISGSPITSTGTLAIGLNLSTAINGLSESTSPAQLNDYAVVQYAGGGTTTTTYHRRKLTNLIVGKAVADQNGDTIHTTYLKLTGGNVTGPVSFGDSVSIDEATLGDLVVNGSVSFVNAKAITNQLIDTLDIATANWTDDTLILTSDVTGDTNVYYRRAAIRAWNYIKGKLNADLTANKLIYANSSTQLASIPNIAYFTGSSTASTPTTYYRLHIHGTTCGNTAANMISNTAGLFSFGDGGPQITFDSSASPGGGQAGAIIFTDNDTAGAGASWHFVSNQTDWNVTSKRFHARTGISIGTNLPVTTYNLYNSGTTYLGHRLTAASIINQIITGSGTAASDAGSGASPRYFPAKWTFNMGQTATNGDIVTIKIPVAGHTYGVFLSIDNGSHYYPVVTGNGTSRLTTHYGNGTPIQLIFDSSGSAADMYALNGADTRATVTGGVWRVLNYYVDGNAYTQAYCSTAAATAAKAASMSGYVATANRYVMITMTTANSSATAITMNINGTGAKAIYINGSASSTSNYTLPAGSYLVFYDGTNYHFRTDGYMPIKLNAVVPTSATNYYPTLTTYTSGVGWISNLNTKTRFSILEGTASAVGKSELILGNNTASGTTANSRGMLTLYSQNTGWGCMIYTNTTTNATITLPAVTGNVLVGSGTNISGKVTVSTSAPSGGADGDIWIVYTA